jgi:hypothetical protein
MAVTWGVVILVNFKSLLNMKWEQNSQDVRIEVERGSEFDGGAHRGGSVKPCAVDRKTQKDSRR